MMYLIRHTLVHCTLLIESVFRSHLLYMAMMLVISKFEQRLARFKVFRTVLPRFLARFSA